MKQSAKLTKTLRRFGLVALAAGFLAGCGDEKVTVAGKPIFYPEPPDPPRLQFLTSFSDVEAWAEQEESSGSSFSDFVLGTEKNTTRRQTGIKSPYGIAIRNGVIYLCDLGNSCVHVIDVINRKYSRLGEKQHFEVPVNVTIDADGTKYVCDTKKAWIVVFDAQDQYVRTLDNSRQCRPIDMAAYGDELYVVDSGQNELEAWSKDGKFLRVLATQGRGPGRLLMPTNIAVDSRGMLYVTDTMGSIINVYDRRGAFQGSIGGPGDQPGYFARPKGLTFDPEGRLYVADAQWEYVQIFAPDRRLLMFFGGNRATPDGMGLPAGVAVDTSCMPAFQKYVTKDFRPEYLLFVTNQFGEHKVGVYAFGKSTTADYTPRKRSPSTRPATRPATQPVEGTAPATQPASG